MTLGINIFSGEPGLGGALTNPTELARRKGAIPRPYPVIYGGKRWIEAESAYQAFKTDDATANDEIMAQVIAAKLLQNPELFDEIQSRGGVAFLEASTHWTGARTPGAQSWEGAGRESRFIRNLIRGFEFALKGQSESQASLF